VTNEQELKEKLAKFAGFAFVDLPYYYEETEGSEEGSYIARKIQQGYYKKDNLAYRSLPDFPKSLDACFEHLMPKAVGLLADSDLSTTIEATYKLFGMWLKVISKSPYNVDYEAMALCLAIEKVIDGEEKWTSKSC